MRRLLWGMVGSGLGIAVFAGSTVAQTVQVDAGFQTPHASGRIVYGSPDGYAAGSYGQYGWQVDGGYDGLDEHERERHRRRLEEEREFRQKQREWEREWAKAQREAEREWEKDRREAEREWEKDRREAEREWLKDVRESQKDHLEQNRKRTEGWR